jgi:hypothetical protein
MSFKGYDVFFTEPGKLNEMECKVCGTLCQVDRDTIGPTSWAEAMGKRGHKHDKFYCPYSEEAWHKKHWNWSRP